MTMSRPAACAPVAPCLRVLCCGVGGQGVLSAARWLGDAAMLDDHEVRVGQLHGMSQRGGSVQATVLIGPGHSSVIGPGEADVLVALEPLELGRTASSPASRKGRFTWIGRSTFSITYSLTTIVSTPRARACSTSPPTSASTSPRAPIDTGAARQTPLVHQSSWGR